MAYELGLPISTVSGHLGCARAELHVLTVAMGLAPVQGKRVTRCCGMLVARPTSPRTKR
jgi:hypothetical protein